MVKIVSILLKIDHYAVSKLIYFIQHCTIVGVSSLLDIDIDPSTSKSIRFPSMVTRIGQESVILIAAKIMFVI